MVLIEKLEGVVIEVFVVFEGVFLVFGKIVVIFKDDGWGFKFFEGFVVGFLDVGVDWEEFDGIVLRKSWFGVGEGCDVVVGEWNFELVFLEEGDEGWIFLMMNGFKVNIYKVVVILGGVIEGKFIFVFEGQIVRYVNLSVKWFVNG